MREWPLLPRAHFPEVPPVAAVHPLRFARPYRRDAVLGTVFSVLNKIFDVLPELLIGVAVDVVVNQRASFLARMGIPEPMDQLWLLVALTALIWIFESTFEYLYALKWRGLAQDLQHELRQAATRTCSSCRRISSPA